MNSVTLGRVFYEYLEINNAKLFTVICLPQGDGKFPTVICRNPYVDAAEQGTEEDICKAKLYEYKGWLDNGYAVVFQHCRGRGKSSGDCVPYIYEREDGLFLQASGNHHQHHQHHGNTYRQESGNFEQAFDNEYNNPYRKNHAHHNCSKQRSPIETIVVPQSLKLDTMILLHHNSTQER